MRASRARALTALLAALLAVAPAVAPAVADDCSGHGTKDTDDKCVCDDPTPAVGATGYVGEECEIETLGVAIPTIDAPLEETGTLPGSKWRCYFANVSEGWNHLQVSLEHPDEDAGDPDVHGVFFDAETRPESQPRVETSAYDFREVSSAAHRFVDVSVSRRDIAADAGEAKNVYLCVQAYGDARTTYTLTAAFSTCPASFTFSANASETTSVSFRECSSPVTSQDQNQQVPGTCDSVTGTCDCAAFDDHTFRAPSEFEGYRVSSLFSDSGLGFSSCAARIDFVDAKLRPNASSPVALFTQQRLSPGSWRFYEFEIGASSDPAGAAPHQVAVALSKDADGGAAAMYARHETVPTNHWGHYDLPEDWVSGTDETQEILITEGDAFWETGKWYVGVCASGGRETVFDISFSYFECPRNCSDRGVCVVSSDAPKTRHCVCDVNPQTNTPYLKDDCSEEFSAWNAPMGTGSGGTSFSVNGTLDSSDYDYFALPDLDVRESRRQIEIVVSASYYKAEAMYDWEAKPALLLKRGVLGVQGRSAFPSASDYTFKVNLENFHEEYKIELCASQFKSATWNAAVYNPERVEPMTYTVSFKKQGVCPSSNAQECSGHGSCRSSDAADPLFATCDCDDGWTASDCNFPSCPEGSYIALPPGADGGPGATCFRGCQGGKRRSSGCDAVVCAPPARAAAAHGSGGNGPIRCVTDECDSDFFKVDEAKDETCVVRCVSSDPTDVSGPRRLQDACDPHTVRSNTREIDDDEDGGATANGWGTFAKVAAAVGAVGVAGVAGFATWRLGGGDAETSLGEKIAGWFRSVRGKFGGESWERRRDPYDEVDAFERADFD
jgi:hypothetical protein